MDWVGRQYSVGHWESREQIMRKYSMVGDTEGYPSIKIRKNWPFGWLFYITMKTTKSNLKNYNYFILNQKSDFNELIFHAPVPCPCATIQRKKIIDLWAALTGWAAGNTWLTRQPNICARPGQTCPQRPVLLTFYRSCPPSSDVGSSWYLPEKLQAIYGSHCALHRSQETTIWMH